jgi:hypothetical protein
MAGDRPVNTAQVAQRESLVRFCCRVPVGALYGPWCVTNAIQLQCSASSTFLTLLGH